MSAPLRVTVDPVNHTAWVAGWKGGDYVTQAGGKPFWVGSRRAWATTISIAADVVAMAERDGRAVVYREVTS